jgi:hypothetical protein
MRLFLAALLAFTAPLFAEWKVVSATTLPNADGLIHRKIECADGTLTATVEAFVFHPSQHTLRVVDSSSGRAEPLLASLGVAAAVNGGYFAPDQTPLGLVIAEGTTLHPFQKARLLSGLVVAAPRSLRLLRTAEFSPIPAIRDALQAGPFLVDRSSPVQGLEATKVAARSVVVAASDSRFALAALSPLTLAEAGRLLDALPIAPGFETRRALNLDGGSSCALWVREPRRFLPPWKPVPNYLAITRIAP